MQNQYSLLYREEEREMFPTLKVSRVHGSSHASFDMGSLPDVWRRLDPLVASRMWLADARHS